MAKNKKSIFLISFFVLIVLSLITLQYKYREDFKKKEILYSLGPETMYNYGYGTILNNYDNLLNKLKRDMHKPFLSIIVSVGPYRRLGELTGTTYSFIDSDRNFIILINNQLFKILTEKEIEALLSHELGHYYYLNYGSTISYTLSEEIIADLASLKYSDGQCLISVITKVYQLNKKSLDNSYFIRIGLIQTFQQDD